jgi:hypothetical protein
MVWRVGGGYEVEDDGLGGRRSGGRAYFDWRIERGASGGADARLTRLDSMQRIFLVLFGKRYDGSTPRS